MSEKQDRIQARTIDRVLEYPVLNQYEVVAHITRLRSIDETSQRSSALVITAEALKGQELKLRLNKLSKLNPKLQELPILEEEMVAVAEAMAMEAEVKEEEEVVESLLVLQLRRLKECAPT